MRISDIEQYQDRRQADDHVRGEESGYSQAGFCLQKYL